MSRNFCNTYLFLKIIRLPRISTLFPYTTLFRSMSKSEFPRSTLRLAIEVGVLRKVANASVEAVRSEEHTSELQSLRHLVCRLLLEKKNTLAEGFNLGARTGIQFDQ